MSCSNPQFTSRGNLSWSCLKSMHTKMSTVSQAKKFTNSPKQQNRGYFDWGSLLSIFNSVRIILWHKQLKTSTSLAKPTYEETFQKVKRICNAQLMKLWHSETKRMEKQMCGNC